MKQTEQEKKKKLEAKIERLKKEQAEYIGRRNLAPHNSAAFFDLMRCVNSYDARIDRAKYVLKYGME